MSSPCSLAQAASIRVENSKSSDAFLPPEDRRNRPDPILIGAVGVPIYADATEQQLDEILSSESVEVAADAIVYFYGDLQARVIGHGRGHSFVQVAWVDDEGLSVTDCHGAFIKTQPFVIIEVSSPSSGLPTNDAEEGG